jgi:archaellum component FlaF (FlaF/FlaG flagellin family)
MKQKFFVGIILAILLLMVVPAVGAVAAAADNATSAIQVSADPPFISATVSPNPAPVGEPVIVSGVATGGNLTAGVQIWVFAGNYVNVSTTPVNADGTYAKTYQTTSLPPTTYYVIVQSPGKDGYLNIVTETFGQYSGQVVNAKTGALIFNFTGTGSAQDYAAAQALSDAFNLPGVDDIYTKCTLELVPATSAAPANMATPPTAPVATATKSPVSPLTLIGGVSLAVLAVAFSSRR